MIAQQHHTQQYIIHNSTSYTTVHHTQQYIIHNSTSYTTVHHTQQYIIHNSTNPTTTNPNHTNQDGYRTLIGEGSGRPLTQAQTLRVSFARALVCMYKGVVCTSVACS